MQFVGLKVCVKHSSRISKESRSQALTIIDHISTSIDRHEVSMHSHGGRSSSVPLIFAFQAVASCMTRRRDASSNGQQSFGTVLGGIGGFFLAPRK